MSITVGDVIQLYTYNSIPPSTKRVIIVAEDGDDFLGVFINTNLHGTAFQKANMQHLQPKFVKDASRTYLDYDSHIDCLQPYQYVKSDFIASLKKNIDNLKGTASKADIALIISLIKQSPTVEPKIIKKYKL